MARVTRPLLWQRSSSSGDSVPVSTLDYHAVKLSTYRGRPVVVGSGTAGAQIGYANRPAAVWRRWRICSRQRGRLNRRCRHGHAHPDPRASGGGWACEEPSSLLTAAGHEVIAPTLTGLAEQDYSPRRSCNWAYTCRTSPRPSSSRISATSAWLGTATAGWHYRELPTGHAAVQLEPQLR